MEYRLHQLAIILQNGRLARVERMAFGPAEPKRLRASHQQPDVARSRLDFKLMIYPEKSLRTGALCRKLTQKAGVFPSHSRNTEQGRNVSRRSYGRMIGMGPGQVPSGAGPRARAVPV
jgi:hypothetical protein